MPTLFNDNLTDTNNLKSSELNVCETSIKDSTEEMSI